LILAKVGHTTFVLYTVVIIRVFCALCEAP